MADQFHNLNSIIIYIKLKLKLYLQKKIEADLK